MIGQVKGCKNKLRDVKKGLRTARASRSAKIGVASLRTCSAAECRFGTATGSLGRYDRTASARPAGCANNHVAFAAAPAPTPTPGTLAPGGRPFVGSRHQGEGRRSELLCRFWFRERIRRLRLHGWMVSGSLKDNASARTGIPSNWHPVELFAGIDLSRGS